MLLCLVLVDMPLLFTASLYRFYYAHCTEQRTEALRDDDICPGSTVSEWQKF